MSMANAGWWIAVSVLVAPVWGQANLDDEKLRGLGRALHRDMVNRAKPFDDALVQAYVTAVGNRLVQQMNAANQYRFEVLITKDAMEPVAFHNGVVVVPAAFLGRVTDETELARGMAHAIGHTELPTLTIQGRPGTISILFSCDRASVIVPMGLRPKWKAIEEDASRFGDDLAQRAVTSPDPAAFAKMQRTVRETLNIRALSIRSPKPPSLYRR